MTADARQGGPGRRPGRGRRRRRSPRSSPTPLSTLSSFSNLPLAGIRLAAGGLVVGKHPVPPSEVDVPPARPTRAQALPAAVLDVDPGPGLSLVLEGDLDLGGVGPVRPDVPEVPETPRRLPDRDLSPVHLPPGGRALRDPAPQ